MISSGLIDDVIAFQIDVVFLCDRDFHVARKIFPRNHFLTMNLTDHFA
jgi:hypothetical protein